MRSLLIPLALLLAMPPAAAQSGCLHRITDPAENEGYADASGAVVIAPGTYTACFTEVFCRTAIVATKAGTFAAIDRRGRVLFEVFPFDNGPDYPSEGLFRVVQDGKIGYADTNGQVVVRPAWDGAFPFENGQARVCAGCTVRSTADGEHGYWSGGDWFVIDRHGRKIRTKP